MKNSERNRAVLENFILHLTHCSEGDPIENEQMKFTPKQMYEVLDEYIKEDHVDGEGNPDDDNDVREIYAVGVKIPTPSGYMMVDINLDDKEKAQLSFYNESDSYTNPKNPWCHGTQWGEPKVALSYEKDTSCFDVIHRLKENLELKPKMKTFRVSAETTTVSHIEVTARTEEEALDKASYIDGGEFLSSDKDGTWELIGATKIK